MLGSLVLRVQKSAAADVEVHAVLQVVPAMLLVWVVLLRLLAWTRTTKTHLTARVVATTSLLR